MDSAIAYEKHAHDFLNGRDRSAIGAEVVRRWACVLPRGAEVIEIACGGGYPITKELVDAGLQLSAIDSSTTLVAEFQSRFPEVQVRCEQVRDSDFFAREFDGAIAIGLLFLLPESEQISLITRVANILVPGGRFLFTAPIEVGTWRDMNTGIECSSLGHNRYKEILEQSDFRIISTYEDEGRNNYYEAEKLK